MKTKVTNEVYKTLKYPIVHEVGSGLHNIDLDGEHLFTLEARKDGSLIVRGYSDSISIEPEGANSAVIRLRHGLRP